MRRAARRAHHRALVEVDGEDPLSLDGAALLDDLSTTTTTHTVAAGEVAARDMGRGEAWAAASVAGWVVCKDVHVHVHVN